MVADAPQIAPITVLVHVLRRRTRRVAMQRTVRMHDVVTAEHARQRRTHHGVRDNLAKLRYRREEVVAASEVSLRADQRVEALEYVMVKALGECGGQAKVAMGDKALHLGIG